MAEKVVGIIAEWNPFHRGHEDMVHSVRKAYGDPFIMAVMSGSFVQRGEPALFDSWTRARWAVEGGVDAVFSLPVLCVLQSADRFGSYGVRLLASMGAEILAFGTESLSEEDLWDAASFSLTPSHKKAFHEALGGGLSYARASYEAMKSHSPFLAEELSKPNNLLGFRYAETILQYHFPMDIHVVHRNMDCNISATTARKELLHGEKTNLLPPKEAEEAAELIKSGCHTDFSRYEDACLLSSRLVSESDLSETGLFSEGLEHKWFREIGNEDYEAMLSRIKSKRYLYSRLKRIGAQLLLSGRGPSPFSAPPLPSYARLLALRRSKSSFLNLIPIPVVTSMARALKKADTGTRLSLEMEIRASDIRSWCQHSPAYRKGRLEFYHSPLIVKR